MNQVYDITEKNDSSVTFTINAKDGENGFPGNITATAKYTVKSDNTLDIEFGATTDKETVVNMTNHSYFNLNGDPSKEGFDQVMYINADKFTPADSLYIPTGEIKSVEGTPMDFRKPAEIGKKVDYNFDQIKNATGYDHNWCLNTYKNGKGDDKQFAQASTHQRAVSFLKYLPTSQAFRFTPVTSKAQVLPASMASSILNT